MISVSEAVTGEPFELFVFGDAAVLVMDSGWSHAETRQRKYIRFDVSAFPDQGSGEQARCDSYYLTGYYQGASLVLDE